MHNVSVLVASRKGGLDELGRNLTEIHQITFPQSIPSIIMGVETVSQFISVATPLDFIFHACDQR